VTMTRLFRNSESLDGSTHVHCRNYFPQITDSREPIMAMSRS
jgi:hypothetical protein